MTKKKVKQLTIQDKYRKQYPWIDSAIFLPEVDMLIAIVEPSSLRANPKNWRIHSQRQRSTYLSFKDKYGWLGLPIYNLRTNRLLDGHMRVDEAIKNGDVCPVILKDLDEDSENEVLAVYDSIGLMAQKNNEALQSLINATSSESMTRAKTQQEQKLQQLKNDLKAFAVETEGRTILPQAKSRVKVTKEEPEEDIESDNDHFVPKTRSEALVTTINKDAIFEGLTDMGIPSLLPEKICTPDLAPKFTYANEESSSLHYFCYTSPHYEGVEVGTIGFYVDDYKFEVVWNDPEAYIEFFLEVNAQCSITPDFSCYNVWPMAKNLWSVYRSRWLGRLWQEADITVIPTIQLLDRSYQQTVKYVLETLPDNCPTVAIECRLSNSKDYDLLVSWINKIVDVVKPECFVLYAGEEKQKFIHGDIRKKIGKRLIDYRFLPQVVTEKKRRKRGKG